MRLIDVDELNINKKKTISIDEIKKAKTFSFADELLKIKSEIKSYSQKKYTSSDSYYIVDYDDIDVIFYRYISKHKQEQKN